jgi:hypothetical protein
MTLDFEGTIVTIIQIIALILLTIGVYPYRIRTKNRNLIIHGFLSIVAMILNLATVFVVMLPGLSSTVFGELTLLQAAAVLFHVGLGLSAVVLGFVIIFSWITHPLGELGCARTWRLMIPTFAVWTATLVLGIIIFVFEII